MPTALIYGAYGYSGELIVERALAVGLKPVIAGRNYDRLRPICDKYDLEYRVFQLEVQQVVQQSLEGIDAVLHCAGPFVHTFRPMVNACIATGTHYLDITGEAAVFESIAATREDAEEAGVMVMPGVGFDVVPSDCLAKHVAGRLPEATHLALGFQALGRLSRGTATTMVENIDQGGLVRVDGRLTTVPTAYKTRSIDFGNGESLGVTIPWGDVATAWRSTRIPNIEVYMAIDRGRLRKMKFLRLLRPLLGLRPVKGWLKGKIRGRKPGPTEEQRARSRCYLWAEATAPDGRTAVSRLETPEGYTLTAMTAVAALQRVLDGDAPAGYQTPSNAYGADFILDLEDVERTDEEITAGS